MKRGIFLLLLLVIPFQGTTAQVDASKSPISWLSFDEALSEAAESGNVILVDIYAIWCGYCQKLQKEVYSQTDIQSYLEDHFEITRLDIEDVETKLQFKGYDLTAAELAAGLGAEATPTTVFLDSEGDYITRLPGFVPPQDFQQVLEYIGSQAFKEKSFQDYLKGID